MAKVSLISINVENRPGTVATALASLAEARINVLSIFGWAPQGILQVIVDDPEAAVDVLRGRGLPLNESEAELVEMANEPGTLHAYLTELASQGVNLRSLSGFGGAEHQQSYLVWTAEK